MTNFRKWKTVIASFVFCAATEIGAPAQTFTSLVSFHRTNGDGPFAPLIQGTDGNLYGTTSQGGDLTCNAPYTCGIIFRITLAGKLTTLHKFEFTDGAQPLAGVILATDGNLYGPRPAVAISPAAADAAQSSR